MRVILIYIILMCGCSSKTRSAKVSVIRVWRDITRMYRFLTLCNSELFILHSLCFVPSVSRRRQSNILWAMRQDDLRHARNHRCLIYISAEIKNHSQIRMCDYHRLMTSVGCDEICFYLPMFARKHFYSYRNPPVFISPWQMFARMIINKARAL